MSEASIERAGRGGGLFSFLRALLGRDRLPERRAARAEPPKAVRPVESPAEDAGPPPPAPTFPLGVKLPRPWEEVEPTLRVRVEQRIAALDRLPLATVRLLPMLENPAADPREVASLAATDPSMAAEIFRLVNSPFFGLRQPVASLHRAVLHLGYSRVKFVVTRLGLERAVPTGSVSERRIRELWRHSFLTCEAVLALQSRLAGLDVHAVHTAALLHDLGKLLQFELEMRDGLAETLELDSDAVPMEERAILEDHCFGVHHGVLGERVSERLHMPPLVRAVQRFHHHPLDVLHGSAPPGTRGAIAAVKLSSLLARAFLQGRAGGRDPIETVFTPPPIAPFRAVFPGLPEFPALLAAVERPLGHALALLDGH